MGLLRRYEQGDNRHSTPDKAVQTPEPTVDPRQPQKKGTRTPTRAEAEAARMARLHPTLTPKEAKKAQRKADREQRLRSLDAAENIPERKLARDHVDSQLTITEFTIPLMLVIMAVSLAFGRNYQVQQATSLAMMTIFVLWIVNITLRWRSFKRIALERGLRPKQRGLMMYLINRMMTIRSLRRPQPRIGRGESY
ncbi:MULTISPECIES: DUF3043 domain-containing protein [unclassified Luteococcus]|uniref:DUF3043 domain-containing protein n=1 Tax=unclassified Luteococcus TaxID=2639923 RepID=UPI00313DB49F